MKAKILALAGAMMMLAGSAQAAGTPPTEEQKAEFYATCIKVAPKAQELCSCKAEAAMKITTTEFMAVIISSMKGATLAEEYFVPYAEYIGRSNQICKPGY
jgi:hypothetical protein